MHNVSYGNDLICKIMNMQGKLISIWRLGSNTRFETDACPGLNANMLTRLFDVFILLHTWQTCVCFGDFLECGHFVMLNIMDLNLISVQSWSYLEREVKVTRKWPINVIKKTSRISLDCKLVPVQYRQYDNGPFRTDSSADKSFHPASICNQFGRLRRGTKIATR